jgi:hypothetical protein
LVLLFRRIGGRACLWGSRSPNLWSRHDHADLDWLPLDVNADLDEYVDLFFRRLDAQLWPMYIQHDGPCKPDGTGISWTPWMLGGSESQPGRPMIEFDFQITGFGWCDAYVSDGQRWLRPTASYLSDAPKALVSAVVAVVRGQVHVACLWTEEPGEYVWIFIRRGEDLELRILWHDDWTTQPSDANHWFTPFESLLQEQARFVINMPIGDLSRSVARAMGRVLEHVGADEYRNGWGMPFPEHEYAELRKYLTDRV